MDRVAKINIEGRNYELIAGGAVEGTSTSQSADWTKILVLPEGAALVDGVFLAITFTYGNTAGFDAPKTVYSDDGVSFFWDAQLTNPVTLPDPRNYTVTLVSGQEYSLIEYPVLYFQDQAFPVCNAKGYKCGGPLWDDGDTITFLFIDHKFFMFLTAVTDQVQSGNTLPVTSGAVYNLGYAQKRNWTQLDLSALDQSKWYPVTFALGVNDWTEVECYVSLDSGTKPSWSSHNQGFSCYLHLFAMGSGWGTTSAQTFVLDRQYSFTTVSNVTIIPCGWTQMTNSSTGVLWLRGGGKYRVWNSKGAAFTIRTDTYTAAEQSVSPTTSYQWSFTTAQSWTTLNGSASSIRDSGNSTAVTAGYSKAGLTETSWLTAWSGYELRAISPATFVLKYIYPVGSIYMSYNNVSPQTFLGGTWQAITGGYFLRASGGHAGTVGQVQAEKLPNITGKVDNAGGTYGVVAFNGNGTSGAFSGGSASGKVYTGSGGGNSIKVLNFNAANGNSTTPDGASSGKIYVDGAHVTPVNIAVYMWRRTA